MPALPPYLIEPIWQQFSALLPERRTNHPLERVMNSIRNGIGMRETEIAKEPSRPWNPHSYAVFRPSS